jgi:DNA polymerase-3 subunit epsilon
VSLVNPEQNIQPFVVNLTGISNNMVKRAPKFYEVAKRIIEITEGCVLVAHNANFDYRILRTEFKRLGYEFERETLCTVDLSKRFFPDFEKYNLDVVCKKLGIAVANRHRAEGDALATVKLFEILMHKDESKDIIQSALKPIVRFRLSERLIKLLDSLPNKLGVFYFHDEKGKILYVDKSKNIKQTVSNLFLRESKKIKTLIQLTESISFELLGNELMNDLKLHKELQFHRPKFNKGKRLNRKPISFSNNNMIIVDKGREIGEQSVILIEDNHYKGSGFVELNNQINDIEILKNLITFETKDLHSNYLINNYLKRNKVSKIIRF